MAIGEIRFAVRSLCANRVFAASAIATLALGIGANTAIFSVVNAVFLRPLPYVHPNRIVSATEYYPHFKRSEILAPEYAAWRGNTAFERLEAYGIAIGVNFSSEGKPAERIQAAHVTPGFFAMLGVQPKIGRTFLSAENQPDIAILSDSLWRNYFHADPRILGKLVTLDGAPAIVA